MARHTLHETRSHTLRQALHRPSILLLLVLSTAASAGAGPIELLSKIPPRHISDTATGDSSTASISADGRYVVFLSDASNVVSGQVEENGSTDVFLYDRVTGTTEIVSRSTTSALTTANDFSEEAVLSADGRFVAFVSYATDLVPGLEDFPETADVFLYDRVTGTIELVSLEGFQAFFPMISADGRFVAYSAGLEDEIEPTGESNNAYVYDRLSRTVTPLAPYAANERSYATSMSADGRFVAFVSLATNVVPGVRDRNRGEDVFLWDRLSGKATLVNHAAGNPLVAANGSSDYPVISADGSFLAFASGASDLFPGQTGVGYGVFLYETATDRTTLVSHARSSRFKVSNNYSIPAAISADGSIVLFNSISTNLVPERIVGDVQTMVAGNTFLYERSTGQVTLVSRSVRDRRATAEKESFAYGLSADGNTAVFVSDASDLVEGDTNGAYDVFLYDRSSQRMTLVSAFNPLTAGFGSSGPVMSADGQWIAFDTSATGFGRGIKDQNDSVDVVLYGRATGDLELVSRRDPDRPSVTSQAATRAVSVSADGRFVVLLSTGAGMIPGLQDANHSFNSDVFLHDRVKSSTLLVSRSVTSRGKSTGNEHCEEALLSADGRYVVYVSSSTDLVRGLAGGGGYNVFLYDRVTRSTTLVTHAPGSPLTAAGLASGSLAISDDGAFIVFEDRGTGLVPGMIDRNGGADIFLYERATGTVSLISRAPGSAATAGDRESLRPRISADGRIIVFESMASDLVEGIDDTNHDPEVFVHDRVSGVTTLVSRVASNPLGAGGGRSPVLSADGRFIAFWSRGTGIAPGQTSSNNFFLYDRVSGTNQLMTGLSESDRPLEPDSFSADGRYAVFHSHLTGLVPGQLDENGSSDVFLFDRQTGRLKLISRAAGSETTTGNSVSSDARISPDGRYVAFLSYATNLVPGPSGPTGANLFLYDQTTGAVTLVSPFPFNFIFSASGNLLAFTSGASDLVPNDLNHSVDAFAMTLP